MPLWLTPFHGFVYFFAEDGGPGIQLYKTNGTLAGTGLVKDTGDQGSQLRAIGGLLYFSADAGTGDGDQLWVSDGTGPGTHQLQAINPTGSAEASNLVGLGKTVLFGADDGTHGRELWKRVP